MDIDDPHFLCRLSLRHCRVGVERTCKAAVVIQLLCARVELFQAEAAPSLMAVKAKLAVTSCLPSKDALRVSYNCLMNTSTSPYDDYIECQGKSIGKCRQRPERVYLGYDLVRPLIGPDLRTKSSSPTILGLHDVCPVAGRALQRSSLCHRCLLDTTPPFCPGRPVAVLVSALPNSQSQS